MNYKKLENLANRYVKSTNVYDNYLYFPNQFKDKRDIEISALFASLFNYGKQLDSMCAIEHVIVDIMNNRPFEYIQGDEYCNYIDNYHTLYCFNTYHNFAMLCNRLRKVYNKYDDLESAVVYTLEQPRNGAKNYAQSVMKLLSGETMVLSPQTKVGNKSINTFLRIMVDEHPMGMNIWSINKKRLIVAVDLQTIIAALDLGIVTKQDTSTYVCMNKITDYARKVFPDEPYRLEYSLRQYYLENGCREK